MPLTAVRETLLEDAEVRVSITKPVNSFDLAGHTAVVTGGNGGIGLGIAKALTAAGAAVAI